MSLASTQGLSRQKGCLEWHTPLLLLTLESARTHIHTHTQKHIPEAHARPQSYMHLLRSLDAPTRTCARVRAHACRQTLGPGEDAIRSWGGLVPPTSISFAIREMVLVLATSAPSRLWPNCAALALNSSCSRLPFHPAAGCHESSLRMPSRTA